MYTFLTKLMNLLLVVAMILGYNSILHDREQKETIAQLEYELTILNQQDKAVSEESEADSPYQDGVYEGSAEGYGGEISVQVTIEQGKLTEVHVVSCDGEDPPYFEAASAVIDEMLETQSADVDTVSGATFSSGGIIHAVEEALQKAEETP